MDAQGGLSHRVAASWRTAAGLGTAISLIAVAAGFPGLAEIGVTWDEPRYFLSVERIQDWSGRALSGDRAEALTSAAIRDAWDQDRYYNPHPPAYKEGMALTDALFGDVLGVPAGYRLSTLLAFGLLVGFVTAAGIRLLGTTAGVAAGLSLLLMPRIFGHAHIGATDIPLTLCWFAASLGACAFSRGARSRWLIAAGVFLGLGLATKFTAFLLPVPLVAWMALQSRNPRALLALASLGAVGLVVAVLVNPAAWPDPIGYQVRLVAESLSRDSSVPISTFYLGREYGFVVPWHHAPVMTLATLPVFIVVLACAGLPAAVRRGPARWVALLCVIQVGFWMSLLALPDSPNHDGVRLWLPMFPFVALLAGLGFAFLGGALRRRISEERANLALLLLGALYFVPTAIASARAGPYYLSYYGELVGGARGAADYGFEATYWFDAVTGSFRNAMEAVLPDSATVVAHPNHEYYQQLQALGLLRADLEFRSEPPADYLILLGRKAMFNDAWNSVYRHAQPEISVVVDGVELAGLYVWTESAAAPDTAAGETP